MKKFILKELRSYFVVVALCFLVGCGSVPERSAFLSQVVDTSKVKLNADSATALWIAGSDYFSSGKLFRLDLKTGILSNPLSSVGLDVHLVPSGDFSSIYLLSRNGSDSITTLKGASALPSASLSMPDMSNPQAVAEDESGRVWIVSLDSNSVLVYTNDLATHLASIDLSSLADTMDTQSPSAELTDVKLVQPGVIAVTAARLDRRDWTPAGESGLALLSTKDFSVIRSELISVPNAIQLFSLDQETGSFVVIGSGSQVPNLPENNRSQLTAMVASFGADAELNEYTKKQSRIINAAKMDSGEIVSIDWRPEEKRSCVRKGMLALTCFTQAEDYETGFVFYRVVTVGNTVFVSFSDGRKSELWLLDSDGSSLQKIAMPLNIVSIAPGP